MPAILLHSSEKMQCSFLFLQCCIHGSNALTSLNAIFTTLTQVYHEQHTHDELTPVFLVCLFPRTPGGFVFCYMSCSTGSWVKISLLPLPQKQLYLQTQSDAWRTILHTADQINRVERPSDHLIYLCNETLNILMFQMKTIWLISTQYNTMWRH